MISLHNILSIAKYERKTLLRSWFFRIFSVLSLLVLFGLNFGMLIQGGGGEGWMIRSIPAAIPYVNLLILNVAQAIIAVFLASDFLKRDKKLDTTEVIYMRSMTNSEYVIGKTWGNLQVFLVLNIAVILMALIFNMLAQGTTVDWISYGIYLLLISVPTLIFIMGLSFLMMSVVRNQAITFVLILGYIGITLFLLQARYYYLFDYMAFNIPMLNSDIIGFGNLDVILRHRGIYFSLGLGFIFLTIFLLKRLPQSEYSTIISLILAIILTGTGGYLGYSHIHNFKTSELMREQAMELNNRYVNEKIPATVEHQINMEHRNDSIFAYSAIRLKNTHPENLKQLILNLNPGLEISQVKLDGKPVPFVRDLHLLRITENISLEPEKDVLLEMNYRGNIDETFCYLDIDEKTMQERYGRFVINVDKRYAFVTPDYILLSPESNWYPQTGVTYSPENVGWYQPQFIRFNLKVKTREDLKAISQGKITQTANGEFSFISENPLTRISLAIGKYKYTSVTSGDKEFGIWYIEGHDHFSQAFPEINDTIPALVNERLQDFERTYNLQYSFDRLFLVETPAQFKTFERTWTSFQECVQPEMVLIPEKGYLMREADLEGSKKRMARGGFGFHDDGPMAPKEIETFTLNNFLRVFTSEQQNNFRGGPPGPGAMSGGEQANPFFIFPMLYNFQNNIQSDKWPITNRIFEAYLKNQVTDIRSVFMRNFSGGNEDEMANIALQDSTFEEILADPQQKRIIDNVIKLKGDVLFSMIEWKAGVEEFEGFLQNLLRESRFKNIPFEEFARKISEEFGIELIPIMDKWFNAKTLPGYLISPVNAVKVKYGEMVRTMVSLKITNFSETEGLVKLTFRLGGFGGRGPGGGGFGGRGPGGDDAVDKLVYLEPGQTKEVSYLLNADPRMVMVNTMTSRNIPQVMTEGFREILEDPKAIPFEGERILETAVQTALPNETIVDNEDPEFQVTEATSQSLLEKWVRKDNENAQKYSGINMMRPPLAWTATTNSDFYGKYIRSAYYIKGGDGSQVARWYVPVKNPGYYDVYFHLYKQRFRRGGDSNEEKGEYHFVIHADDGMEEQALNIQGAEEGWNLLGSFYFSPDTALIELNNRSEQRIVFADAVKLVEQ